MLVAPTLYYDFANQQALSGIIGPTIQYSRGSAATYYDQYGVIQTASNNQPRFDHDPSTVISRTNYARNSNNFLASNWGGYFVTPDLAQNATDPFGNPNTAWTFSLSSAVGGSTSNVTGIILSDSESSTGYEPIRIPNGTTVTVSIWAKIDSNEGFNGAGFGLNDNHGTTVTLTNQWQRFTYTGVYNYGDAGPPPYGWRGVEFVVSKNSGYTGNNKVYIYGAQLEVGSTATNYIPTSSSSVTVYSQLAASKGLLIEESRTNLLTYSEALDNTAWTTGNVYVSANATIAPDNTSNADKIYGDGTNNGHWIGYPITLTPSTIYTISMYAKSAENSYTYIAFLGDGSSYSYSTFNLTNGTVGADQVNVLSRVITPVGNGWYRAAITFKTNNTLGSNHVEIATLPTDTIAASTTTGGINIWGVQVEQGSFPTSYISTAGTTVTRNADVATVPVSAFYNQYEGSYIVSGGTSPTTYPRNNSPALFYNDGSAYNDLSLVSTNISAVDYRYGPPVNGVDLAVYGVNQSNFTIAASYTPTTHSLYSQSTVSTVTNLGTPLSPTLLYLGNSYDDVNVGYLNGTLSKFVYYPKQLAKSFLLNPTDLLNGYTYVLQPSATAGFLYHSQSFDTVNDLVVTFDYACYGTVPLSAANEGFSVFFVNAAPGSVMGGGPGPGLCYAPISGLSASNSTGFASFSGAQNGALGIGFDLTGNFSSNTYSPHGLNTAVPNSISIRDSSDNNYGLLYNSGNLSGSNFPFNYTFYQQISSLSATQNLTYDRIRVRLTDFGQRVLIDIKRSSDLYFTNFINFLVPATTWWPDIVNCCLGFATGDGSTSFKIKNFNVNGLFLNQYRIWDYTLDSTTLSGSFFISTATPSLSTTDYKLQVGQNIIIKNSPPYSNIAPLINITPGGIEGLQSGDNYILVTTTYTNF